MLSGLERTFTWPAEWSEHEAVWSAWPDHPDWGDDLTTVREEVAGLFRAIRADGKGELLRILVRNEADALDLRSRIPHLDPQLLVGAPYGDIWLRDTGPLFVRGPTGGIRATCFRFNGWGEKFVMKGDTEVATFVAEHLGVDRYSEEMVLEGGAVETDGEGTLLTTRQCLLSPVRNPSLNQEETEARLRAALGVECVLWLENGLANDHTDGHVDNLARFVGPGQVLCMRPGPGDPNRAVLEKIFRDLKAMRDARGRRLKVLSIPSPGPVLDAASNPLPASYLNFFIANAAVVVPLFGRPQDEDAVAGIAELFPSREVVGLPARALLGGGGTFHCITQQQPKSLEMRI